jgi:hypothetical protein
MVAWLTPAAQGGPVEDAIQAAVRLSEQPNYSWVTTVADDARTYDIIGQTERGGLTRVKMPVINSVRRQLGRSVTDTQIEFFFRGNVACVVETERGWRRPDELPLPELVDAGTTGANDVISLPAGTGPVPADASILRGSVVRLPKARPPKDQTPRAYSNLQLAISHPHEDLGVIVGSHATFVVEHETVTGSLTELGAQLLLVRDGQEYVTPRAAAGVFKLWIREGLVTKYQVRLEGILDVHLPNGRRQIRVNQVSDTVVRAIGSTRFEIPAEVREKLGAPSSSSAP